MASKANFRCIETYRYTDTQLPMHVPGLRRGHGEVGYGYTSTHLPKSPGSFSNKHWSLCDLQQPHPHRPRDHWSRQKYLAQVGLPQGHQSLFCPSRRLTRGCTEQAEISHSIYFSFPYLILLYIGLMARVSALATATGILPSPFLPSHRQQCI